MKKRLLVVDDDQSIRESLKKILQAAGYDVVLAGGGLDAVTRYESERIDLVILDLNLPNQSGWDVFERLTSHYPLVPIVIITGLPNQYPMALAAGAGALFEKPIDAMALLKALADLLAESAEARLQRLSGKTEDTRYVTAAGLVANEWRNGKLRSAASERTGIPLHPGPEGAS